MTRQLSFQKRETAPDKTETKMANCSLINLYFLSAAILPGISVFLYLCVPVGTVKLFGGDISAKATRDAAQLWVRTTSNGDILVSILNGLALFKPSDWHFRQTVIRVCSFSNLVHFGCFLYHHYFVQPHPLGLTIMYWFAIALTLLSGLGWGLNWDSILKRNVKKDDYIQCNRLILC
jgi:hypothetical protein